jgi:hypothetical protein
VLPGREHRSGHLGMQVVGRAVVHDVDVGDSQDLVEGSERPRDAEAGGGLGSAVGGAAQDPRDLYTGQSPKRI